MPEGESGETLAVLTHFGILFGGFILPLVIYLTEGTHNGFVRDHSREALNFQILFSILWFGCFVVFWIGLFTSSTTTPSERPPTAFFLFFPLFGAVWLFGVVCSIVGAVRAGQGRRYRYPVSIRFVRG